MTIRQKHQRIESLEWEIMREEYQCESNPCRSKKKMADLRNELKKDRKSTRLNSSHAT